MGYPVTLFASQLDLSLVTPLVKAYAIPPKIWPLTTICWQIAREEIVNVPVNLLGPRQSKTFQAFRATYAD